MAHKTLCIGPAGSGKTQFAITMLRQFRRGRAIVLVPDAVQKYVVKTRIQGNRRVRVHQFSSLAHLILRAHSADVTDLSDTMQRMLLRAVIRTLHASGTLPTFASVCYKPGFIATVGQLIAEMQDAQVPPNNLIAATVTPYDVELGYIYSAYMAEMQNVNRADRRYLLSLARDSLHINPHLLANVELFIVDGFDQFTPLQLSLLTEIARHAQQSIITLTGEESRMRPAHRRFQRTRTHLEHTYQPDDIRMLSSAQPTGTTMVHTPFHPTLAFLERHLFDLDTPTPLDANGALTVIETADREREVRAALRHVRRLRDAGTAPEHIAIFFRKRLPYAPLLREIAREYALPLALYDSLPLIEVPSIVAMLTLFRLRQENYPRRMLVETWRSFADGRLSPEPLHTFMQTHNPDISVPVDWERAASMIDRVAYDSQIATGLSRLQTLLGTFAQTGPIAIDAAVDEDEFAPTISADNAAHLHRVLDAFHTWLKPPTKTTLDAHVAWVRERIVCTCSIHTTDQYAQPHALLAHILEELQQVAHTLSEPPMTFATFLTELIAALSSSHYGRQKLQPETIAALPVIVARTLHFDHVILLGMVEGEFPLAMTNPPLYTHRERAALAQQRITIPPPDPADERSLFYEAITRARCSLTLTRTYLDERGNTLPASPYLNALLDLVQRASIPLQRIGAGSVPTMHDAASPQEMLVALVKTAYDRQGAWPTATDMDHDTKRLLEHVVRACAIEQDREGTSAYGPFEGMLHDEALIAEVKNHFGSEHRWSITQFNDYRTCPFRFAASHILRLKQRGEPEEGIESVGRGRIYHAILAKAGETWKDAQYPFSAQHEQPIIQALNDAANEILVAAPVRYGFRPGAFWHWEQADIRRRLVQAVRRVLYEGGDWTAFHVVEVEKTFGMGSTTIPLDIPTPDGMVQVIGRVDRIDERDNGALALIDYKSTSTVRPLKETLNGQDVQMPIYLMAVEHIIKPGQQVERAGFFHLGSGKYSSPLTDDTRDQAHDAMIESVTETVRGVQSGVFVVRPRDRCPTGCMYASICRLNLSKKYLFG